jgi:glucose/arabinose dehydrogenase
MRIGTTSLVCLLALVILASDAVAQEPAIRTRRVASGLSLPVGVYHPPGDTERLFIVEKTGRIRILTLANEQVLATPFIDLSSSTTGGTSTNSEQGLLGLAFHPDYANNGYFYVNYTGSGGATTIRRFTVSANNANVANASSGTTILTIPQPFGNHNGGWIGFGPDGYLYIGTGDGGSGNDPGNRSQQIGSGQLLGKMLRIDVDGGSPFAIPPTNPFANGGGDNRIWAWGLRNPWRCSFDRETGDLWIADVGQNAREEVNFQPAGVGGQNYGWRCMEGTNCTGLSGCTCNSSALTMPVWSYSQASNDRSITGGVVYRGCGIEGLQGTYFFADYVSGRVWSLRYDGVSVSGYQVRTTQFTPSIEGVTVNQIVAFGEDAQGEVYVVDQGSTTTGQIFKIIAASGEAPCPPETTPGDINGDGLVDGTDLGLLLAAWGECPPSGDCPADVNGDGRINGSDLGVLLNNWGK